MRAIGRNKLPAAKYLISKGADVNAHYGDSTALSFALINKNGRMIELLQDHAAEVNDGQKSCLQRIRDIKR